MLLLLLSMTARAQDDLLLVDVLRELAITWAEPEPCRRALGPTATPEACEIWVLHQLLTTSGPYNEAADGALQITYFWPFGPAFVRPNIKRISDGARLGDLPSYEEGKSAAQVWRMPDAYLGDLVADEPVWTFRGKDFHTFGACAEREVSTCLIARSWGYRAKVHFKINHVQTWVWLGPDLELRLDTTFDDIRAGQPLQDQASAWQRDTGGSARADPSCQSAYWLDHVRGIEVSQRRAVEMADQAEIWFTK